MKTVHMLRSFALAGLLLWEMLNVNLACACPFCAAPIMTLSEQFALSDAAVVVIWVRGTMGDEETPGSTTLEIAQVVRGPKTLRQKQQITLDRYRPGAAGDLFLLLGSLDGTLEWQAPLEVTEVSLQYILQAPNPELSPGKRLRYFLRFLEHSNQQIANDAFGEFANSEYRNIAELASDLPRDKIRKWMRSTSTPGNRIGFYGMLLGLCGDASDARYLAQRIQERDDDSFRLGVDGMIGGYLLLTGADGLPLIEKTMIRDKSAPFSDTYSAVQALRFMWTYSSGTIEKSRLRQSMRIMLDRPEFADLIIADLARWQDWDVRDQLMRLYGQGEYSYPAVKRSIIRFILAEIASAPKDHTGPIPPHVVQAEACLQQLRARDPKLVADVIRFSMQLDGPLTSTATGAEKVVNKPKSKTSLRGTRK